MKLTTLVVLAVNLIAAFQRSYADVEGDSLASLAATDQAERSDQPQAAFEDQKLVTSDNSRSRNLQSHKKLIGATSGWKFPSQLLNELSDLQDLPFEGIDIYTNFGDMAFAKHFSYANHAGGVSGELGSIKVMEQIVSRGQWGQFTHNFMHMTIAENFDWYDDLAWADILLKVGAVARIGRAGGVAGLMLDLEGHPIDRIEPWDYREQPQRRNHSFFEMQEQVRTRGRQFIDAVQQVTPNATLFLLFWTSMHHVVSIDSESSIFGLINSFMLGVLENAGPGITIIDGDEPSYDARTMADFARGNFQITCDAIGNGLIPPDLAEKYLEKVSVAHPVWDDDARIPSAFEMTDRVYSAMMRSDEFVWLYTEGSRQYLNHQNIRPWTIEAIESGKARAMEDSSRSRRTP